MIPAIDERQRKLRAPTTFALVFVTAFAAFCGNVFAQVTTTPALYPSFDPGVSDYVIRCDGDPVQVHVDTPPDNSASVDGQPAHEGSIDAQVNVTTGQSFTITMKGPGSPDATYHVRCLPTEFPTWSAERNGTPQSAFYLTTPSVPVTGGAGYVVLFDTNGVPVWWFESPPQPIDATFLPDGNIAWSHYPQPIPDGFEEHNLDGTFVRQVRAVSDGYTDPHDLQQLSNGDYLVAALVPHQMDQRPCGGPSRAAIGDILLQEVRADGSVVWSWDTADHIPLSEIPAMWHDLCVAGDAYHFNAVEPVGDNQVLISYRHLNAIYKVDVTTGDVLWKLGGVPTAKSLTIVGDPYNGFTGQHDIRSLGDGTVTLHDNETGTTNTPRVVRYRIDEATKTATLVEQATNSAITSSVCCGSARELPGGNWVILWGGNSLLTEQTAAGDTAFRLDGAFLYRAQPVTSGLSASALRTAMDAQYPRPTITDGAPDPIRPVPPAVVGPEKIGPDATPPIFRLTADRVQHVLRQKGLLVEVGCPIEACRARAKGSVVVPGAAKLFKLRTAKAEIRKGTRARLLLRFSKGTLKALRRALEERKAIKATVSISVRDAAGNAAAKLRTFRLKR
jgi:Arylsulfotransferase (ASST)